MEHSFTKSKVANVDFNFFFFLDIFVEDRLKWIEVFVNTIVFGMGLVACHLLDLRDWDIFEVPHHLSVSVRKWQVGL